LAIYSNAVLALRGRVAWAHDRVSDPTLVPVFQALPGASFIVDGATPAKNSALTSAGAELRLANGVSLLAKFDGAFPPPSCTSAGPGPFRAAWCSPVLLGALAALAQPFAGNAAAARRAQRLFVGLSDDRRFFVPVLVLFVVVVLVVIIVGISRRYRVAAYDGDETPNVLGDPWRHFGSCSDVATFTVDVSARERGRQSVCIAGLHY